MENKIVKLKEKLRKYETRDLLGMIGIHFMTFANDGHDVAFESDIFNKTNLMSPQKQYLYLAGLLMSTDDLSNGAIHDTFSDFQNIENDIQEITSQYALGFIQLDDDTIKNHPEDIKKNFVSAEAFTSYFDMGILRYEEQTENLIRSLYSPFDAELEKLTSLRVDDYIDFYHFIYTAFSDSMDKPKRAMEDIFSFLETLNPNAANIDDGYQRMLDFASGSVRDDMQDTIDGMNTVCTSDIISHFGEEKGNALIKAFSLDRKERDFGYYNGDNPFVRRPLCWLDEKTLYIVHPQFILNAVFDYITDTLEAPKNSFADKYKKVKADTVETLFLNCLKSTLKDNAKYHTSVCEEKGTKEHDILIEIGDYIIIAEVKASKVREPFFNPTKAYTRVHDHFHSDSGIGGAYKQAIILKKFLEEKESVTIFENKTQPFIISDIPKKTILPIVLTLNQFGGLAVNTSLLLEKEDSQPYPWVCNLHDFENIIEINRYLNKTPSDFIDYLVWRIKHHPHIFSSDELDVFEGYYLDNSIRNKDVNSDIIIPPNGPSLIDKIYFEKHGIPYTHPNLDKKPIKRKKYGVNEPCPCGSGKKFKKCCRGKGIYD